MAHRRKTKSTLLIPPAPTPLIDPPRSPSVAEQLSYLEDAYDNLGFRIQQLRKELNRFLRDQQTEIQG